LTTHPYAKPAGVSFLIHLTLLFLALALAVRVVPPSPAPAPIEVEFTPSKLVSMGAGSLHFTQGSSAPRAPRPAPKVKVRTAAVTPAAKPTPADPAPAKAPTTIDEPPPPLPDEISDTSVAIAPSGDKVSEGGGSGSGTGGSSGGGGKGGLGTGSGASSGVGEGSGEGGGYGVSGLLSGALPWYPASARRAGREGVVTVRVLVGTDGKPVSVTVRVSSGHEDFDTAAVTAVKKWLFAPARRGKEPVASFHDVRIRFRLDEAR